jgi:hypothetical protein
MRTEQEYALMVYQPYAVIAFHPLFAALGNPKYERVNTDWEVRSSGSVDSWWMVDDSARVAFY